MNPPSSSEKFYYVYILESENHPEHYYIGITTDLDRRQDDHNRGKTVSSNKFRPWRLKTFVAFREKDKAHAFEKYLKTGSGRAFTIKHL